MVTLLVIISCGLINFHSMSGHAEPSVNPVGTPDPYGKQISLGEAKFSSTGQVWWFAVAKICGTGDDNAWLGALTQMLGALAGVIATVAFTRRIKA